MYKMAILLLGLLLLLLGVFTPILTLFVELEIDKIVFFLYCMSCDICLHFCFQYGVHCNKVINVYPKQRPDNIRNNQIYSKKQRVLYVCEGLQCGRSSIHPSSLQPLLFPDT